MYWTIDTEPMIQYLLIYCMFCFSSSFDSRIIEQVCMKHEYTSAILQDWDSRKPVHLEIRSGTWITFESPFQKLASLGMESSSGGSSKTLFIPPDWRSSKITCDVNVRTGRSFKRRIHICLQVVHLVGPNNFIAKVDRNFGAHSWSYNFRNSPVFLTALLTKRPFLISSLNGWSEHMS